MREVVLCVALAGCGRLGFDARSTGDGGGSALTLVYPVHTVYAVIDATAVSLVPTVSEPARFAIAPALPAGVTIDAATGTISGVPHTATETRYTVTATAGADTATALIDLTALAGFVVTTTADTTDANAGDMLCADASGLCSLRAALSTANALPGPELVLLDAMTYPVSSLLPPITTDVMIAGASAQTTRIVSATPHAAYHALQLASAHTLRLRDLGIDQFGGDDGGAISETAGTLDVDRCEFTDNASPTSGGVLFVNGGASATFQHCTFTSNASLGGNGGGWGGVIDGEGSATTVVVRTSTATLNHTAWGAFSHITTGTTLLLENSTLFANTSTTAGTLATPGGIYTLVNDTIVGNTNTGADSAGLYSFQAPCHYTVTNTIVAANTNPNGSANCNRRDLTTTMDSGGGNIFSDAGANCGMYFTAQNDRLTTDPGVASGPPADHGGFTATILLVPGAAAIGTGIAAACPATDQRDHPRPPGSCDVGAVQMP